VSQRESLTEAQARRASALKSALGPLAAFLEDPRVVEVMLNADGAVWVERIGQGVVRSPATMVRGDAERMLRLVASEVGSELNAQQPSLAAKLPPPWGARLQAAIPPIVDAPVFALRKPARVVFSLADYVAQGILSAPQREVLEGAVRAHENILIGGGTGSGKTTFANALVKVVAEETTDRVHIVEDTPELQCTAPNRLQVLVQPGVHTWRDAIMAAMRFRPDRILVGEVRDGSALELLKAWNTGHPGGIATIHANDTRAMLDRLCQLIEEVVHPAPRALVAQTIQLCVHIQRRQHPDLVKAEGERADGGPEDEGDGARQACEKDRLTERAMERDFQACGPAHTSKPPE
jgi:type IV secretion system protein VirB11